MIKAILVDDERLSLEELEFLLKKHQEISVVGTFLNPVVALQHIRQLKPQVVFLDINMPQLGGIDAALKIVEENPDTDIVFVTGFDKYAIKAFEIQVLDYILKPINPNRLKKTIERVVKKRMIMPKNEDKKLKIKCLGGFSVGWENQNAIRWRSEKTKELFAYLVQNKGRNIPKEELLDKLWGEDNTERAICQLYNGIYYIRKALQEYEIDIIIISTDNNYNLTLGTVDLDILYFYEYERGNYADTVEALKELEALYIGDYLEGRYYSWADIEKERLSKIYMRCLTELSRKLMEEEKWNQAETYLLKAYNQNAYIESITELLLKLYIETGDKSKAVTHFNTYSHLIKDELGIKPTEKLYALYKCIKLNNYSIKTLVK